MTDANVTNTTPIQPIPTAVPVRKWSRRSASALRPQPASHAGQRLAAAILEVLAGVRTPTDAAAALDIGVARYYLWEQRALTGLVAACEPRPIGPGHSLQRQVRALEEQVVRLKQDCARHQALVRVAQRTIGLAPPPSPKVVSKANGKAGDRAATKGGGKAAGKPPRKHRPVVRALKAAAAIRAAAVAEADLPSSSGVVETEVLQRSVPSPLSSSAAGGAGDPVALSAAASNQPMEE